VIDSRASHVPAQLKLARAAAAAAAEGAGPRRACRQRVGGVPSGRERQPRFLSAPWDRCSPPPSTPGVEVAGGLGGRCLDPAEEAPLAPSLPFALVRCLLT
jgi:hypothetical protein